MWRPRRNDCLEEIPMAALLVDLWDTFSSFIDELLA